MTSEVHPRNHYQNDCDEASDYPACISGFVEMYQNESVEKNSKLSVSAGAAVVFGAVVADIFD